MVAVETVSMVTTVCDAKRDAASGVGGVPRYSGTLDMALNVGRVAWAEADKGRDASILDCRVQPLTLTPHHWLLPPRLPALDPAQLEAERKPASGPGPKLENVR